MNLSDGIPKLRMAEPEPSEMLAKRVEREQRSANYQREENLSDALSPFRVGSVRYLNAVPLTRGLESEIIFDTPANLAGMLRRDELDAALVSVTEVLFSDQYDILDGIAIASLGEVYSVLLAHKHPIAELREVHCHAASLSSVNLLKVLLAERGLKPEFKTLSDPALAAQHDAVLLIGDPAIDFHRAPHEHEILDLGSAWFELTRLPFVYAVWALRRVVANKELRRRLTEAKEFGLDTIDSIISSRTEYDLDFRKDYLGWHVHYHLGSDEKRGLSKFVQLLRKHELGTVFEPKFVN